MVTTSVNGTQTVSTTYGIQVAQATTGSASFTNAAAATSASQTGGADATIVAAGGSLIGTLLTALMLL